MLSDVKVTAVTPSPANHAQSTSGVVSCRESSVELNDPCPCSRQLRCPPDAVVMGGKCSAAPRAWIVDLQLLHHVRCLHACDFSVPAVPSDISVWMVTHQGREGCWEGQCAAHHRHSHCEERNAGKLGGRRRLGRPGVLTAWKRHFLFLWQCHMDGQGTSCLGGSVAWRSGWRWGSSAADLRSQIALWGSLRPSAHLASHLASQRGWPLRSGIPRSAAKGLPVVIHPGMSWGKQPGQDQPESGVLSTLCSLCPSGHGRPEPTCPGTSLLSLAQVPPDDGRPVLLRSWLLHPEAHVPPAADRGAGLQCVLYQAAPEPHARSASPLSSPLPAVHVSSVSVRGGHPPECAGRKIQATFLFSFFNWAIYHNPQFEGLVHLLNVPPLCIKSPPH